MIRKDTSYSSKEKNLPRRTLNSEHRYAPNTRAPSFVKEVLLKLKAHIIPHTIIVGDFNTPLGIRQH